MSNFYFIVKLKQVQVYFMTKHCWPYDFNLHFNSQVINMKLLPKISIHWQTGNENTQTNQAEDVILIHHQILITNCEGYV